MSTLRKRKIEPLITRLLIAAALAFMLFAAYQDLSAQEVTISVTDQPLTRVDDSILPDDKCTFQLVRMNGTGAWDFGKVVNLPMSDDCVQRSWKDDIAPGETAKYRLRVIETDGLKSNWTNIATKTIPPLDPPRKVKPRKQSLDVE